MLNDIERKFLRIISNHIQTHRNITIKELSIRTGRTPKDVEHILQSLLKKKYIVISDNRIKLFKANYKSNDKKIDLSYLN